MTTRESCLLCQIVANRIPSYKVYEDELTLAVLDVNGGNPGHCFVIPKNHYPILEQIPDHELGNHFVVANKISSAIFETLKAQGTNIFVRNGIPAGQQVAHFMINVVPRKENDGINLQWKPRQLSEEEMSTVELKLKEQVKGRGIQKTQKTQTAKSQEAPKPELVTDDEDDYFMRQIRRMP
ncbi:HIT domain-containing protein [Candidatus Woesearchaeota archaeon]|nr:HIT domain-containing protein [Candidatus Woesearchaeota archaeon]